MPTSTIKDNNINYDTKPNTTTTNKMEKYSDDLTQLAKD